MGALHPAFTTTSHVLELTSCQIGLLPLQRVTRHERYLLLSAITYAACGCVHGALKFWWLHFQHPGTHAGGTTLDAARGGACDLASTAMPIQRDKN